MKSHSKSWKLLSQSDLIANGLQTSSIKEAAVHLLDQNRQTQRLQAIEFYARYNETSSYPLTAVDIVSNTYHRMSYQKSNGSSATLGSSVVGSCSFRTSDNVFHFIPKIINAKLILTKDTRPEVTIIGKYGELAQITIKRLYQPPSNFINTCNVEIQFEALRKIELAKYLLTRDAFRFCTISSMYTPNLYDGNILEYLDAKAKLRNHRLNQETERGEYLFVQNPTVSSMIGVVKDKHSHGEPNTPGSPDSPSIHINLKQSQYSLGLQSYLAKTLNINSDSLSVWLEWQDAPEIIQQGEKILFSYTVTASMPKQ